MVEFQREVTGLPHAKSADKKQRRAEARRMMNRMTIKRMKNAIDRADAARASGGEVDALYRSAVSMIDRAASRGAIHRNTAARNKSRLARRLRQSAD